MSHVERARGPDEACSLVFETTVVNYLEVSEIQRENFITSKCIRGIYYVKLTDNFFLFRNNFKMFFYFTYFFNFLYTNRFSQIEGVHAKKQLFNFFSFSKKNYDYNYKYTNETNLIIHNIIMDNPIETCFSVKEPDR